MGTPQPAPDPGAATDVPRERARLPLQAEGRDWFRRGRQAEPEDFDLIPDAEAPARQGLAVGVVQVTPDAPAEGEPPPAEGLERLEEADTDHGATAAAQVEVWKWHDPYLGLAPPERSVAYLAHMCELMERAERRYQQQDPRDPVLTEALEQTQQRYNGRRGKLIRTGSELVGALAQARGATAGQAAAVSGLVASGLVTMGLIAEFVLDHLDTLVALMRGL